MPAKDRIKVTDPDAPDRTLIGDDQGVAPDMFVPKVTDPSMQGMVQSSTLPAMDQMIAWMAGHLVEEEEDTMEVYRRMAEQLHKAASVDAVLNGGETTGAEKVIGIPLWIDRVEYQEADEAYQDGLPYFAILRVRRSDTREEDVVTVGAVGVVMQIVELHMRGAFPLVLCIRQKTRRTKKGHYPLYIGPPM